MKNKKHKNLALVQGFCVLLLFKMAIISYDEHMMTLVGLTVAFCVILGTLLVAFMFALALRDNSIVDVFYGLAFALAAFGVYFTLGTPSIVGSVILFLVGVWAVRLSMRIFLKRKRKGEDFRYKAWRDAWEKKGRWYFIGRSLLQIYLLQSIVAFFVLLPSILLLLYVPEGAGFGAVSGIGICLWLCGFLIESVADMQIDTFANAQAHKARPQKLLATGLFAYSRRPNYFGESLMWWGIWFVVLGTLGVSFGIIALVSPLLITYIVTCVTGPMLEAKWARNKAFQAYRKKTSYFILLPQHK